MFANAPLSAVELLVERRLGTEEGEELLAYDDATGKRVVAPVGNLSWGIGFNLMTCGSHELFVVMLTFFVQKIETALQAYSWYGGLPCAVQSAVLDIAYNAGVGGLLHYPRMIACLEAKDFAGAAAQCQTSNPALRDRYRELAALIASGASPPNSAAA